jgi:hypothetical protein
MGAESDKGNLHVAHDIGGEADRTIDRGPNADTIDETSEAVGASHNGALDVVEGPDAEKIAAFRRSDTFAVIRRIVPNAEVKFENGLFRVSYAIYVGPAKTTRVVYHDYYDSEGKFIPARSHKETPDRDERQGGTRALRYLG